MARIRTVKPEFWDDELMGSLSRDARLLFIGTWNFADDEARLRWSAAYLKSKVFPYDEDLGTNEVSGLMTELEKSGRVYVYTVTGESITQTFAVITHFTRHQRINRAQDSSLPPPPPFTPPPGNSAPQITEHSVKAHGSNHDGSTRAQPQITGGSTPERKGKELKERSLAPLAETPDGFPAFWAAYPRKVDKRIAERAYRAALKRGVKPDELLAGARRYAEEKRGTEARFVKHASSWLNAGAHENPAEPRLGRLSIVDDQDPAVTGKRRTQLS